MSGVCVTRPEAGMRMTLGFAWFQGRSVTERLFLKQQAEGPSPPLSGEG